MSFRNPTYNQLAQAAHFFGAATVILVASHFAYQYIAAGLILLYALVKEFWFDIKYERPEVSGGIDGGIMDAMFYVLGSTAALLFAWRFHL